MSISCTALCSAILTSFFPWRRCSVNRTKFCVDRKTLPCLQNASQHVPVYLQQFPSYSNHNFKKSPFLRTPAYIFLFALGLWQSRNVAWMKRQFRACQTPRSMYPSIFNSFTVIRTATAKIAVFAYRSLHFCFPWRRPCNQLWLTMQYLAWMERQFNACQTPYRLQHVPIYHRLRGSASTVLTATGQVNGR